MATRKQTNPIEVATQRLLQLATRGVQPGRMAREVESIISEWLGGESDPFAVRERLDELFTLLDAGVADAEEQAADADASEPAFVKQAGQTLAALVASRDAAARARAGL
ncbi:hypothetical protein IAI18_13265 [Acetobacteraceae bacterium H6797]|nr:hypothetical protein [Acetobacteraceae bacterium H6797]